MFFFGMKDYETWKKKSTLQKTYQENTFQRAVRRGGEIPTCDWSQCALLCEIEEAKKYVKRAIKADSSLKAEFLDDPGFDPVWESF